MASPPQVVVFQIINPLRETFRNFHPHCKDLFPASVSGFARFCGPDLHSGALVTKLTRITIETDSLLILHGRTSDRVWCRGCEAEVGTISLENVGVISNLERAALEEWLNSGELHRLQTEDGSMLICLNSLLARVQNKKTS
jgi:hypothetical protein